MTTPLGTLIYSVGGQQQRYQLQAGSNRIGRDPDYELVLDQEGVSYDHALIICLAGTILLSDRKSTNGTFVNGSKLATGTQHTLRDGDTIQIGLVILQFVGTQSRQNQAIAEPRTVSRAVAPAWPRPMIINPPRTQRDAISGAPPQAFLQMAQRSRLMDLLPELYQADAPSFFNRFLLIFQSFLDPLDREISQIHHYFDPLIAPVGMLPWLESWAAIAYGDTLPIDRRRRLIQQAAALYQRRGTRRGLSEYLEICTGVRPIIVEPGDPLPFADMVSPTQNMFVVLLTISSHNQLNRPLLEQIIEAEKPAHTAYILDIRLASGEA